MDRSAIESIGQLAIEAQKANHIDADTPALILRDQSGAQKVVSIEHLQPGRSRFRGAFATRQLPDFAAYVTAETENTPRPAGSVQGFIDTDDMSAKVFFNLGNLEHAGHADHHATLKLKPTAAYAALQAATIRSLDQRALHDFVEDWRDNIVPLFDGQPDANRLANTLAAIRDITVETARKVNLVERDMGATRSAMESVDARSTLTLPSGFEFRAVPYEGLAERTFRLRLGVTTGGDKVGLVLRIQQAEQSTEDIAKDFRDRLAAKLGTACPLTLGTFTP
ncbi:MAG TPA: DUF2303 family protein [Frateuria sp.]|uniref:DUF2303 family protein n=1 Tax=Frateuria sp. TaxID=2211372 RepID=UPI002D7E885F|nr:DUF2303 family protein [Frateuria sp.]HET6807224.1 DUF2303 family protein [Frateuria sp.]